jgi:hypothetical protein
MQEQHSRSRFAFAILLAAFASMTKYLITGDINALVRCGVEF